MNFKHFFRALLFFACIQMTICSFAMKTERGNDEQLQQALRRIDYLERDAKKYRAKEDKKNKLTAIATLLMGSAALVSIDKEAQSESLNRFLGMTAGISLFMGMISFKPKDSFDRVLTGAAYCLGGLGAVAASRTMVNFSKDTNTKLLVGGLAGLGAGSTLLVSAYKKLTNKPVDAYDK